MDNATNEDLFDLIHGRKTLNQLRMENGLVLITDPHADMFLKVDNRKLITELSSIILNDILNKSTSIGDLFRFSTSTKIIETLKEKYNHELDYQDIKEIINRVKNLIEEIPLKNNPILQGDSRLEIFLEGRGFGNG
ncbi:hypothetical protein [Bacillus sp. 03113]|uniref:hypothetical protein n=1 Tax=Bacillus sp. 03113 TaxID=2578211 RepID=UPI001142F6AB|nr:hypothetical protein [Bacillus sp. 03113]